MTLCQKCQGAVATVIITNIPAGGKPIGIHLCKKCAMAEGVITGPEQAGPPAGLPLQALAGMLPSTLPQGGAPAMLHLQAPWVCCRPGCRSNGNALIAASRCQR